MPLIRTAQIQRLQMRTPQERCPYKGAGVEVGTGLLSKKLSRVWCEMTITREVFIGFFVCGGYLR